MNKTINPPAILVVGPAWVGDMVMAQVLFRLLKQHDPQAAIDVLAPAWSVPLLARMPEVRASIDLPLAHGQFAFFARLKMGRALRGQYQRAIVLPNSWKSALVPFFADIPTRTGWRGEMRHGLLNDVRQLNKPVLPLMIERFAALAFPQNRPLPVDLPWPLLSIQQEERQAALHKHGLQLDRPVLALCPGAEFGASKRWPERHYAAVAAARIAAGEQVWLFGSQNDCRVAQQIKQALPESQQSFCRNLAGKTSLADAMDLLSCASAVVSNDSGLMHIAAALQRKLVVLYGSSSPHFTPPLTHFAAVVQHPIACSPCFQRKCPLQHHRCMTELSPAQVLAALEALPQPVGVSE